MRFSFARTRLLATRSRLHSSAPRDIRARRCLLRRGKYRGSSKKEGIERSERNDDGHDEREEEEEEQKTEEMLTVVPRETSLRSLGPSVYATR